MTQEAFFGFRSRPFQAPPQVDEFVPLEPTVEAIELLCEAARKGDGIGVLTAAPGAGKTVVCLQIQSRLEGEFATALLTDCSFPTRRAMLQAILHTLGREYAGLSEQEARLALIDAAQSLRGERAGIVVIADEAHQLGPRLLEELRCLTNHVSHGQPLIRVLLSGQLALEEQLIRPELHALNYRITCHISLEPLTMRQSARFVVDRLHRVGGDAGSLFTDEALEMICRISDGNPRCLTQIADACLSHLTDEELATIDAVVVRRVLRDLKQLPLQWNESACDQIADENELADEPQRDAADDDDFAPGDAILTESSPHHLRHENRIPHMNSEQTVWSSNVATIEIGGDVDETVENRQLTEQGESEPRPRAIGGPISKSQAGTGAMKGRSAKANPLQEIAVHDLYATLDRGAAEDRTVETIEAFLAWTESTSARVKVEPNTEKQSRTSSENLTVGTEPVSPRLSMSIADDLPPDEKIHLVIQAVSDAVAIEIAQEKCRMVTPIGLPHQSRDRAQACTANWRATPEPSEFDVIEPALGGEQPDCPLQIVAVAEECPPAMEATAVRDCEGRGDMAVETLESALVESSPVTGPQGKERPYARLFSRARRARTRA